MDLDLHIRCKGESDFGKIFKVFIRACSFDLLHFLYIIYIYIYIYRKREKEKEKERNAKMIAHLNDVLYIET